MADMSAILSGFGGINAGLNMLKTVVDVRDQVQVSAAIVDIQNKLLSTQTAVFAAHTAQAELLEQVRALKEKIASMESWATEQDRYQLTDFGDGTFAYLLKTEKANGEPVHRLCANCFQRQQKAILQFSHRGSGQDYYNCQSCGKTQPFGHRARQPINTSPRALY
ncbi:MAG: hypothetical protein AB7I36_07270 [Rhodospirillaceae bacterium]